MEVYLGIDVSKKTLDACLIRNDQKNIKAKFNNTPQGHKKLENWLKGYAYSSLHACVEATGIYDLALCEFLYNKGYKISRMNPLIIKRFGQTVMTRSKTDSNDSAIIAQYCSLHKPKQWKPDSEHIKKLKDLVQCLNCLIEDQTRIKCRFEKYTHTSLPSKKIWQDQLKSIKTKRTEVEKKIKKLIDSDSDMKENQTLLESIPGLGKRSSQLLLSQINNIDDYQNARQLAAHIGVTPCHRQSGTSLQGRSSISKMGSSQLRKALYFPAMTAMRHNPILKQFADRLIATGKPMKLVIIATMRKLIHIIYGVLKRKTFFDEKFQIYVDS